MGMEGTVLSGDPEEVQGIGTVSTLGKRLNGMYCCSVTGMENDSN